MGTLLAAMQSSSDIGQLNDLGKAYAAAAVKLDEKGAREAVAALLAAMKSSTDPNQLVALGKAYATAAVKLDEKGAWASEAVDMLLAAMKSSTDPRLGQAYAAVAVKLDEKGAREAVDALLAAMKSSTDPRQQAALGHAYAAAAVKLDEKGARARKAVDMLLAAMKSSTDSDQLAALGQAYAAAAERLPDTALSGVLDELIAAIKPSGDHGSSITHAQLHALTLSAASLLARMQPPDMADTRMREFLLIRAASGASWEPFFTALAKARKSGDDVPTMLAVAMRLQSLSAVGTAHAGQ